MNKENSLFWVEIKNTLVNEGLESTISRLKIVLPPNSTYFDNIILIEREFRDINSDYTRGIISEEYRRLVFNRINDKLLSIINQLSKSSLAINQSYAHLTVKPDNLTKQIRIANFMSEFEKGIIRGYLVENTETFILNKHININNYNNFINIVITREFRKIYEGSYWRVKSLKNEYQWYIQLDLSKIGTVNIIDNSKNISDYFKEGMTTLSFASRSSENGIKTRSEQLEINNSIISFPGREYSKTDWSSKQIFEIQMSMNKIDGSKFIENFSQILRAINSY